MKKQIIVIHGGGSFSTYEKYIEFLKNQNIDRSRLKPRMDWKDNLQADLGENFDVLMPTMPNKTNANYLEWKIMFDKVLEIVDKEIIFIGHSLGALVLVKYLSENQITKDICSLHLVSGPFNSDGLDGEDLGRFPLSDNLSKVTSQASKIYIYHSTDDKVVPVSHATQYAKALDTDKIRIFNNLGHIKIEHFPELVSDVLGS